jgi:hypothetical protein
MYSKRTLKTPFYFLATLLLLFCQKGFAQSSCGADIFHQQMMATNPGYAAKVQQMNAQWAGLMNSSNFINFAPSGTVYEIPVVVHVMHTGGAVGTTYNPSDATITALIDYLTQTFNATYASYPSTSTGGVYIPVKFTLAKRTSACASTTGINRVNVSATYPTYSTYGMAFAAANGPTELQVKNLSRWSHTEYLNIWIVNKIDSYDGVTGGGTAGFAATNGYYFPAQDGPTVLAAVAVAGNAALPHEVGHSFGLYHTFEGDNGGVSCPSNSNCNTDNDLVCDTEPNIRSGSNNCPSTNACVASSNGNIVKNIMNYSSCMNRFTDGQKTRFLYHLTTYRPGLINSLGCVAPSGSTVVSNSCTLTSNNPSNSYGIGPTKVTLGDMTVASTAYSDDHLAIDDKTCVQRSNVIAGQSYTLAITTETNVQAVWAFIDYNNDGQYNLSERVYLHNGSTANETHSTTITIPGTATTCAPLRMRVYADGGSGLSVWNDGCGSVSATAGTLNYGQAEDYAVYVKPAATSSLSLSIALTSGVNPSCTNSSLTFTPTPSSTLTSPSYTWYKNNVSVATGATYTASTAIVNNDVILCKVNFTNSCGSADSMFSNSFTVTRQGSSVTPSLTIQASPSSISNVSTSVSFSISASANTGTTPTYQWYKDGSAVAGATSSTYVNASWGSSNTVYCAMTPNLCASPTTANSNTIALTVPAVIPTITSFTPSTAIPGSSVTITGTNFNTTAANNIVYFGGAKGTVTVASATSLTVTVPAGATAGPITVMNNDGNPRTAVSKSNFTPTYSGTGTDFGDSSFTTPATIASAGAGSNSILADLDGDGKLDIIIANGGANLSLYRNISSSGSLTASSFASRIDLSGAAGPNFAKVVDLDNDGKLDIVTSTTGSTITVYKNNSSSGSFSFSSAVNFSAGSNLQSIAVTDVDGDGRLDLIAPDAFFATYILKNNSNAGTINSSSFSSALTITTGFGPGDATSSDLDGDGKPDLAFPNYYDNNIQVFRNTSTSGSFSMATATTISGNGLTNPRRMALADVDADGKADLVVGTNNSTVFVYKNNSTSGSLSFATPVTFTVSAPVVGIRVGDLDGDGKPDISAATGSTISILKNIGTTGAITATSFLVSSFSSGGDAADVALGDMDGDGKPEMTFALVGNNMGFVRKLTVTKPVITSFTPKSGIPGSSVTITGTGFNAYTTGNIVYFGATSATVTAASSTSLTVTVPIGATYSRISLMNKGSNLKAYSADNFMPTFAGSPANEFTSSSFKPKVDFSSGTAPSDTKVADLDGDGLSEVIVVNTSSNTVSLFRNISYPGGFWTGSFATKVDLTTGTSPAALEVADLDGDGKPEIIVANSGANSISVFKNNSTSGNISFSAKVDYGTVNVPACFAIADFDGDGNTDIAVGAGSGTVGLLRNTGYRSTVFSTASFNSSVTFSPGGIAIRISAGDLDLDGKPELICGSSYSTSNIVVFRNIATAGTLNASSFAAAVNFPTSGYSSYSAVGDIDGDGKPELVTTTSSGTVAVLRNTSTPGSITSGSFASAVNFATGYDPEGVSIGDLNGDGKADIAFGTWAANAVSVLPNTATSGSITSSSFGTMMQYGTGNEPDIVRIADIDGDGWNDLVTANYLSNNISVLRKTIMQVWTGSVSTDWHTGANWSTGLLPENEDYAIIPSGVSNMPVVPAGSESVTVLDVRAGATVNLSSNSFLFVSDGPFILNGTITGSGRVVLSDDHTTSPLSITGTGTVSNVEMSNQYGAVISPGSTLNITGTYYPENGTLTTNGGLVLKSSLSSTARIDQKVAGTISGNVIVERSIPASGRRAWRLLSAPVESSGAPTIYSSWQENGGFAAGLGTSITQAGGAAVAGSFDAGQTSSTSSSIRQYNNATNTLTTPAGTNIAITSQPAWFLYVRGDRTLNFINNNTTSGNTTLRITGLLKQGNQDFTVPAANYALIGNPFASPIDFSLAAVNASTTNTLNKYWVWDPKLNTSGGYVLFDAGLGYVPSVTGGSYSTATSIIQSGQGFFVKSNGTAGNLRIQEDDKASTWQNVFKTTNGNDALLRVKLNMNDGTGFTVADGVIAAFNANNSSNVDVEDGEKLTHFGTNLALYRSNQFLSIEKRTDPVANDTLHMAVYNGSAGAYQLVVEGTNFAASSLVPYLLDNYTNTTTTLSLSSPTTVNFNITTDTLSYGMNRFKIVFQNNVPLASNDIILNAEKTEQGNRINWTVRSESNIAGYEVQRSNDGRGFQVINSVAAKSNNNQNTTYNYLDENPGKSDNFYRIHATGIDGRELYSSTVRVRSEAKSGTISVTPNPITGQSFNLQLDNMTAADYKMEMFNSVGQLVKMENIHHAGGSSAYIISLPASASKGVYLVKLTSGEKIITQKIQVQ